MVYVGSGTALVTNVAKGSSYTHSVMRSCTFCAKASLSVSRIAVPLVNVSLNRRLRSRRVTFPKPQLRHTPTAFVLHAD